MDVAVAVGVLVGVAVAAAVGVGVGAVGSFPMRLTDLPSTVRVAAIGVWLTGANDTAMEQELFGRTELQPVTAEKGGFAELVTAGSGSVIELLLMTERFWLAISPLETVPKLIPKVLKVCLKLRDDWVGDSFHAEPSPSWPLPLLPHAQSVPSFLMATV